jgi:PAS domain S-box-containing protein
MSVDAHPHHSHPIRTAESETRPLSAEERSHLRGRWRAAWPATVVAASLLSLIIVPLIILGATRGEWNEMETVLNPARALTTEIQLSLALELSSTEEFLQTGRQRAADDHQSARARRHLAETQLIPLARRLGPSVERSATQLLAEVRPAEALLDSLIARKIPQQDYSRRVEDQRQLFRAVVITASRIDEAIGAAADRIRLDIQSTERIGRIVESVLIIVALLAWIVVARLARHQRSLAIRLDRRERSQTAFANAARRLNAAATARDVVGTLVNTALEATNAYGCVVELARKSPAREPIDVAMRLGSEAMQEARVDRAASIGHALEHASGGEPVESRNARTITELRAVSGGVAPYLASRCNRCTGLATIVNSDGDIRATLVLLRETDAEPFGDADVAYLHALGDLGSAAFRRVDLLEALRESEERFRQIAENIREFIWLSDPEFTRHFYVNSAYEDIWGRSTESLYENPWSLVDGVHPDDRARVATALAGLSRGVYDIEFRVVRPDGDERWVWSRGFPVLNERGEIYRVAGITEDITERKRAAESRVRLVRGFTHDVKNPLGAADGFLALLDDGVMGNLEPQQHDGIVRARQSIRRALELIRNVLELARAEAGQVEVRMAPMEPAAVAVEIVDEFRAQARDKGLSLEVADVTRLPAIESDASRVRQIAANLVSNAVKYTPPGGHIEVRVCQRSDRDAPEPGDWIAIQVADDGPGIPKDKQRTLFTEFTRFDPDAAEGAGIGLAISQRLAMALGGTITFRPGDGGGSTFTLWLPVNSSRDPATPATV